MGALSRIKIADFSRVLAGPYATMLLGDMGAEVIKIERPFVGDDTRTWGPPFDAEGRATYFQSVNRNKSGVTADLSTPEGRGKVREIIATSDVLVENFNVGAMEKFGLGYEALKDLYPGLIYCSISGFGTSEQARDLPGYDLLVQGMSGLMSVTGPDSDHPTKVGVALVDVLAGLHATVGILAALHHRNTTGLGQKIEINLLSSALSGMVNQTGAYAGARVTPRALGNAHPSIAPYESYKALDGDFMVAVGNDKQFEKFCKVLQTDLADAAKFSTNSSRVKNRVDMNALISPILAKRKSSEWIAELTKVGVPAGPINNIAQAIELATSLGLNPLIGIPDSVGGTSTTIANPITFSATPVEYHSAPPALGSSD